MTTSSGITRRKVLLLELNEITWRLLDPLLKSGELPAISRLIERGVRGTTIAPEVPPDLDPWISWTTVYTGRMPNEHGVKFLEQPPETVQGPRIWDIAADAGKSVGIFGSIMSWPPRRDVQGFWVPGTFSPDTKTYPDELEPIQQLNLTYTRAHTPLAANERRPGKLTLLQKLLGLGLRFSTLGAIAAYFARRALGQAREWEKVSLQPRINLDFFARLWKRHQPDFATFHTNHIAHYQHRYWRAADPEPFLDKPSVEERKKYGGAIRLGYRTADQVLKELDNIVDHDTVLMIASGLGAQPYVKEEFRGGRSVVRLRNIQQALELLGILGDCEPYSVMAPQWNIRFESRDAQQRAVRGLKSAYYKTEDLPLFAHVMAGNTICLNVCQKLPRPLDPDADCVFPETNRVVKMRDLCVEKDSTPKQGYHEQAGVVIMAGPGIRAGFDLGECSTVDLAPTILHLLGLAVPEYMAGQILYEALDPTAARLTPRSATKALAAAVRA